MLYLDTSAFLKLYLKEHGSEAVQQLVTGQRHPLPVWEIQQMELINSVGEGVDSETVAVRSVSLK